MKRVVFIICAVVMCVMCTSCLDRKGSSSKKEDRGDYGKLEYLSGSTIIKGIQLEHQSIWKDEPEIDQIVKEHGFSNTSEYYEFEIDEWFAVYIDCITNDTFTVYVVKYDEKTDYRYMTEDEAKTTCIDKSLEDKAPDKNNYGDMGNFSVDKDDGGKIGDYVLVVFRMGRPEVMMKIKIVPSTAPSASEVKEELQKMKDNE